MSNGVIITLVICITILSMHVVTNICDTIRDLKLDEMEREETEDNGN